MDTTAAVKSDRNLYHDSTYEIVSIAAYLIGVPERIFLNDHEPPKIEVYRRLDLNKNARIIRHLCLLRTAIEQNYKFINELMKFEFKSIINMPEYVPYESIRQLAEDGVSVARKSCQKPSDYIVEINRVISDRINNCKSLFPMWLNWEYMRDIFIMPDGLTNEGTKAAADIYYENKPFYPYQVYMNWPPSDEGNIFYNDKKFITLLYAWHNDYFADISKVTDAGVYVKVDSAVEKAVQLAEQCASFHVVSVAGVEIVYVAVEYARVHHGVLHICAALFALGHHEKPRPRQRAYEPPVIRIARNNDE